MLPASLPYPTPSCLVFLLKTDKAVESVKLARMRKSNNCERAGFWVREAILLNKVVGSANISVKASAFHQLIY